MKPRAYNIRIGIYEVTPVPDGYGGSTVSPILISNSWAKMDEGTGNKATAFGLRSTDSGLTNFNSPVVFRLRKRNDLNYNERNLYVMYNDDKYIIQGLKHDEQEVELFCTKSSPVTIPLIGVI